MRFLALVTLLGLAGCGSVAAPPDTPATANPSAPDIGGDYSNYGQAVKQGAHEVWDLSVREIEPGAFLAQRSARFDGYAQARLYRFLAAPGGELELQVSLLQAGQESWPAAQLLSAGTAVAGCSLYGSFSAGGWSGGTRDNRCSHRHPVYGDMLVRHRLELNADAWVERLELLPIGPEGAETIELHYRKVRDYRAWVGVHDTDEDSGERRSRLSEIVSLRDDARPVPLATAEGDDLGLALSLAWLEWREGEPDYLQLRVVRADTGELAAMHWVMPGQTTIEFNSDWLQVWAEPQPAE